MPPTVGRSRATVGGATLPRPWPHFRHVTNVTLPGKECLDLDLRDGAVDGVGEAGIEGAQFVCGALCEIDQIREGTPIHLDSRGRGVGLHDEQGTFRLYACSYIDMSSIQRYVQWAHLDGCLIGHRDIGAGSHPCDPP